MRVLYYIGLFLHISVTLTSTTCHWIAIKRQGGKKPKWRVHSFSSCLPDGNPLLAIFLALQGFHARLCPCNDDWCAHGEVNGGMQLLCSVAGSLHGTEHFLAISIFVRLIYERQCISWNTLFFPSLTAKRIFRQKTYGPFRVYIERGTIEGIFIDQPLPVIGA